MPNNITWTKAELEAYDKVSIREQDDRGRITCAVREAVTEKEEEMAEKAKQREEELTKEFKQEKEEMAKEAKRKEEENAKELRRKEEENAELRREREEMAKEFRRKEEENAEKNLNVAKVFLSLGVSIENTAKATGLTVEEVRKLKDKK